MGLDRSADGRLVGRVQVVGTDRLDFLVDVRQVCLPAKVLDGPHHVFPPAHVIAP